MMNELSVQRMQFSADPDDWGWVRWQWCQPGALPMPWMHAFGFELWDDHKDDEVFGPQIRMHPSEWRGSQVSPYPGTGLIGDEAAWTLGVPLAERTPADVVATCGGETWGADVPVLVALDGREMTEGIRMGEGGAEAGGSAGRLLHGQGGAEGGGGGDWTLGPFGPCAVNSLSLNFSLNIPDLEFYTGTMLRTGATTYAGTISVRGEPTTFEFRGFPDRYELRITSAFGTGPWEVLTIFHCFPTLSGGKNPYPVPVEGGPTNGSVNIT